MYHEILQADLPVVARAPYSILVITQMPNVLVHRKEGLDERKKEIKKQRNKFCGN